MLFVLFFTKHGLFDNFTFCSNNTFFINRVLIWNN